MFDAKFGLLSGRSAWVVRQAVSNAGELGEMGHNQFNINEWNG